MIYAIISVSVLSALAGYKRPVLGGLVGAFLYPLLYCFFFNFEMFIFSIMVPAGFIFGFTLGIFCNRLYLLFSEDFHPSKPSFRSMPGPGGGGGSWGGGIVYTDEEERNAKDNERHIR